MFFVAVATLVPVLITFCVVAARATTPGVLVVGVALRAATFCVVCFVPVRGAVRVPTAARADTAGADVVVFDVVVRPRGDAGRVAEKAVSPTKLAINKDITNKRFIIFPSIIMIFYHNDIFFVTKNMKILSFLYLLTQTHFVHIKKSAKLIFFVGRGGFLTLLLIVFVILFVAFCLVYASGGVGR